MANCTEHIDKNIVNTKMIKLYTIFIILLYVGSPLRQNGFSTYKGAEEFPIFTNYHILYFADPANKIYHLLSKKYSKDLYCANFEKSVVNKKYGVLIYRI